MTYIVSGTNKDGVPVSKTFNVLRFMPFYNPTNVKSDYKLKTNNVIMAGLLSSRIQNISIYKDYKMHSTRLGENGAFVLKGTFYLHDGPDSLSEHGWASAGCIEVVGVNGFTNLKTTICRFAGLKGVNLTSELTKIASKGYLSLNLMQADKPSIIRKHR